MTISKDMIAMLVCPLCKADLILKSDARETRDFLYCVQCNLEYPVEGGIPIMLQPTLRIRREQGEVSESLSIKRANIEYYVDREKERDKWKNQPGKRIELPRFLDFIFRYLDKPNMKVLDACSGVGMLSSLLCDRGFRLTCFDISRDCIAVARKDDIRLKNSFVADAEDIPLADNSFDSVCFFGSLHHLPNPQKALCEAFRVLQNGGRVILIETNNRSTGIMVKIITIMLKLILRPRLGIKDVVLTYKKLLARISKKAVIEYQDKKYVRDGSGRWVFYGETNQEFTILYVLKQAQSAGFKVLEVRTQGISTALATLYSKDINYEMRQKLQRIDQVFLEKIPILNKYGDRMLVALEK